MKARRAPVFGSLAAAIAGLAAAGCTPPERTRPETSLVVAEESDPGTFNPAITTSDDVHRVTDQIFNGLVGLDAELNPVPELATSWDVVDEGRTYTFHLRPDVVWHDGTPFSSADVKFTFEEALLKFHSRARAALSPIVAGIDAPDPQTVVFRFRQPYGPFLQRLDVVEAPILPKHAFAGRDIGSTPAKLAPVGTGPFEFVTYEKGQVVELKRNPRYFRRGFPRLDRLIFRVLPSTTRPVAALEHRDVDFVPSVPPADFARLNNLAGITVAESTGASGSAFCQEVLVPNLTRPPFSVLDVRRAFYTALDRGAIVDRVYFGRGTPSTGPISRHLAWAYSSDVTEYPTDPAAAGRLLDGAGYPRRANGDRLSVSFTHPVQASALGAIVREQLKTVGIDLVLDPLDPTAAVDKIFVRKSFDLGFASFCNGADPEIGVRRMYSSSSIGPTPFSYGAGYSSPQVDALFDQAARLLDRASRARVYAEIQRWLSDDVPYFWLVDRKSASAFRSGFGSFRLWTGAFAEGVERAGSR
jgi:peptide/nickel transport system substrate-binding protein